MEGNPFWCWCGKVGLPQYQGNCKKHAGIKEPKKKSASPKFRGASKYQKNMGMFDGVKEN